MGIVVSIPSVTIGEGGFFVAGRTNEMGRKKSMDLGTLAVDEVRLRCSYPARSTDHRTGG